MNISPNLISQTAQKDMRQRLNDLAKPVDGLGHLEALAVKLAGIEGTTDLKLDQRCCLQFAGDHGIVEEDVSATPKRVTAQQSINSLDHTTTIGVLSDLFHCDLKVIDVGVDHQFSDPRIIDAKIAPGTNNFLHQSAMTRSQAKQALQVGFDQANQAIKEGNNVLLIGEIGIGNTSSASAIIAAALNLPASEVVGRGSNISDQKMAHKLAVIQEALDNKTIDSSDPIDILSKVGGYEIGAMCGAIIAAANAGVPLVLDGFLTYSACILAQKFIPDIGEHVIASHSSHENGTKVALKSLGLKANFNLDLAVGEGSGAALLLPWFDAIENLLEKMMTLQKMQVAFAK